MVGLVVTENDGWLAFRVDVGTGRSACATRTTQLREEGSGFAEEEVEGVVVEPVAGGGDGDEAAVADGLEAGIVDSGMGRKLSWPQKKSVGAVMWLKISTASGMLWPYGGKARE